MKLANGSEIPVIGLGTWKIEPAKVNELIREAISVGYRHFDCSPIYMNEKEVGAALKNVFQDGTVSRDQDLQLDYLDLYLIHWPFAFKKQSNEVAVRDSTGRVTLENVSFEETWSAMEALYRQGRVKAIGVSNFNTGNLDLLLKSPKCSVKPMVNQVELHPYLPQPKLLSYCQKHQIVVTAYSPLGSGNGNPLLLKDKTIAKVAEREQLTCAQVLIAWAVNRNTVVIPRTSNPKRLTENFCQRKLSVESMNEIDSIQIKHRYIQPKPAFGYECFDVE